MTVFRGYMTIIKRNLNILLLYMGIFIVFIIMTQSSTETKGAIEFVPERMNIGVVDRDGGAVSKGFAEYMGKSHNIVPLADNKEKLQEELFYRNVDYIVIIPKDFETACVTGQKALEKVIIPGSEMAYYVDQSIDAFLKGMQVYTAAGYSSAEALDTVLEQGDKETKVTLLDQNGNGGSINKPHLHLISLFPFLFIAVLCYAVSLIMVANQQIEIKRRLECSAVPLWRRNMETILAIAAVGAVFLIIILLLVTVMTGKEFWSDSHLVYLLLNILLMLLVALALAFVVGVAAKGADSIDGIVNVLSLAMCFLGGVFVSADLLGSTVRKIAQFLPTYWFEENLMIMAKYANLTEGMKSDLYKGMGIQLVFAAACICVALVISKIKRQEN